MPIDNDNNEVPWVGDSPWDSTDSNTRLPTPGEIASGFPCGAADQALFNFVIAYAWGQIYNALLEAGETPDLTDLTQLAGLLDLKAPIDSPVFTGVPEAPTASAGDSTTQIATTQFVTSAVSSITTADKVVILTTSGSFTVPSGVTSLKIYAWGGGGGGCGAQASPFRPSSGGGGGGFCFSSVTVTPGQVIPYIIGSGGSGSAVNATSAGAGGTTSILTISAGGGAGGLPVALGAGVGGAASGGSLLNVVGGRAEGGGTNSELNGGAGGSSLWGGVGGNGSPYVAGAGMFPGGGGAGGGHDGSVGTAGGNGAPGLIMIVY